VSPTRARVIVTILLVALAALLGDGGQPKDWF
jgi:hypothetical protein